MLSHFSLFLCALSIIGTALLAPAANGLIVGLETIPNRVRNDNPALAAARWTIQEAVGRNQAAGLRDNPEIQAGLSQAHTQVEGAIEVGVFQRFPITDRLQLEKQITATQIRQAQAEVREVERSLVLEARSYLVEILSIRQQLGLRSQQAEVANELARFIGEAASRGELSPLDAGQAQLEAARLAGEIPRLRASEVAFVGKLKPLLGMSPSETLTIAGKSLPAAALADYGISIRDRPDLQATELETEAARQAIALARAARYDDVQLGMVAGLERFEDIPAGYQLEGTIGVRVTFALPFWNQNKGQIVTAEATAQRKELESQALAAQIRNEADSARQEMMQWAELLQNIEGELLPLAEKQAKETNSAYRQGLTNLQATLRAREQALELADSRIQTLRSFQLARIRYEASLGIN